MDARALRARARRDKPPAQAGTSADSGSGDGVRRLQLRRRPIPGWTYSLGGEPCPTSHGGC
eukprot:343940-Chlamydomonas_euryale.AAC.5